MALIKFTMKNWKNGCLTPPFIQCGIDDLRINESEFFGLEEKKTALLTIIYLVRRVLQIFRSCIGNFKIFRHRNTEKRIGSFHN